MFTIQGLLHFYKDRVCGPNLDRTLLFIRRPFQTTLLSDSKGLGSRRGEIGPAIEMHTDLKYVYMVYFIEKNRNFICLGLKL